MSEDEDSIDPALIDTDDDYFVVDVDPADEERDLHDADEHEGLKP